MKLTDRERRSYIEAEDLPVVKPRGKNLGGANGSAKLDDLKVIQIRMNIENWSRSEWAAHFKVSHETIKNVQMHRTWKHV